jgi:hypothetical protein
MALFCKKNLTPLQRRTLGLMSSAIMLTVVTNLTIPGLSNPLFDAFPALARWAAPNGHSPALYATVLSVASLLPILLAAWAAARYLKAEPDEFIRAVVIPALLWGSAITMAGNTIAGVLMNVYSHPFPLALLNADLFFISTGFAFRLIHWSYQ